MYSFHSHSVLWLITRNIFTNIEEQAIVGCLKYIYNLFNEIKELVKVSKQIWIFYIWNGFWAEHLYKCEKNEYMEWSSPISSPWDLYLDLPFCFVEELLRDREWRKLNLDIECWTGSKLSGESREFGSDFTSRDEEVDAAEDPPKLLELSVFCSLLLFEVRPVWKRIFSSISSIQTTAICLAKASWTQMPAKVFFFFPHCQTEP